MAILACRYSAKRHVRSDADARPLRVSHQRDFSLCKLGTGTPHGKAGFVLDSKQPEDWYWLEDPIPAGELGALAAAGKLDRYIPVDPHGPWGFLDAVNELFLRTGIARAAFDRVGARPEWFDRTALLT